MDEIQSEPPHHSLVTSYRSSKLKIVLLFMLQIFFVISSFILSIIVDEYKNLSKSFVKDMDFKITFTDDSNIEIGGQLEISSALSTSLYISDLYAHVYIDTEDDIKYMKDLNRTYKDKYAPPLLVHIPFTKPQLINPAKMDATQTTILKVKGTMSIPVIPNIIRKIEENLHSKLKQFRFNIYPTLTMEFGLIRLRMSRGFTIPYEISQGSFLKIVEPENYTGYPGKDTKKKLFDQVIIAAWMNIENMPLNVDGFKFESYYIKFENSVGFDFSGEVVDFKVISTKEYPNMVTNEESDFPVYKTEDDTMYNLYAVIALKQLIQNKLSTHALNLLRLSDYNDTSKRTHVTVLGRRGAYEWLNVCDRLKLVAYRDLNLKFFIGNEENVI